MQKHSTAYHFFITLLLALSVLGAYAIDQALQPTNLAQWSWLISPPSALGLFAFLNWTLYGKFLWSLPLMRLLGIVEVPDLRGRWEGTLVSSFNQEQILCAFEIEQSAHHILVWAYFERSTSSPIAANFVTVNHRQYLHFTYDNDTGALSTDGMHDHKGTMSLEFHNGELRGSYFNARGNHGDVVLERKGDGLLHCYRA